MATTLQEQLQHALGDSYRLERELAPGGMSRLFVATEQSLQRQVVVKLLPPELASDVSAERFRREMLVTARLQHPHILPVLNAGARGELLYYVMPYVAGESLRTRLEREGRLEVAESVRILRELADALACAHAASVVHRDLKPENVLLQHGHAVLADFAVSGALAHAPGERLTGTGLGLGTPGYMAPEQLVGAPDVDARADLYALGVLAYVRGPFRMYTVDANGNESIVRFSPEGAWIGDLQSFATGVATQYFIDAIEASEALLVDHPS